MPLPRGPTSGGFPPVSGGFTPWRPGFRFVHSGTSLSAVVFDLTKMSCHGRSNRPRAPGGHRLHPSRGSNPRVTQPANYSCFGGIEQTGMSVDV